MNMGRTAPKAATTKALRSVLIAEFDSIAQARAMRPTSDRTVAQSIARLSEQLRVGLMLSERLVVTDAMLLDGKYFQALGPMGVLAELGMSASKFPIVITGVNNTLRGGLEFHLANTEFRWSSGSEWPHGQPTPAVRRVWEEWIQAVESGMVTYISQDGGAPEIVLPDAPALIATSDTVSHLRTIIRRSDALTYVESQTQLSAAERSAAWEWWNDAYLSALATKVGADWLDFSVATEVSDGNHHLMAIPTSLIEWSGQSSPANFALGFDATTKQREKLHKDPKARVLRGLSFVATSERTRMPRWRVLAEAGVRVTVALVLILIALPFVPIFDADGPLAWWIFAVVALTTFPFADVLTLLQTLRSEPHAYVLVRPSKEPS